MNEKAIINNTMEDIVQHFGHDYEESDLTVTHDGASLTLEFVAGERTGCDFDSYQIVMKVKETGSLFGFDGYYSSHGGAEFDSVDRIYPVKIITVQQYVSA